MFSSANWDKATQTTSEEPFDDLPQRQPTKHSHCDNTRFTAMLLSLLSSLKRILPAANWWLIGSSCWPGGTRRSQEPTSQETPWDFHCMDGHINPNFIEQIHQKYNEEKKTNCYGKTSYGLLGFMSSVLIQLSGSSGVTMELVVGGFLNVDAFCGLHVSTTWHNVAFKVSVSSKKFVSIFRLLQSWAQDAASCLL